VVWQDGVLLGKVEERIELRVVEVENVAAELREQRAA